MLFARGLLAARGLIGRRAGALQHQGADGGRLQHDQQRRDCRRERKLRRRETRDPIAEPIGEVAEGRAERLAPRRRGDAGPQPVERLASRRWNRFVGGDGRVALLAGERHMSLNFRMLAHIALHPRALPRIEPARDIPGQQRLDLVALAQLVAHHGHPRSMPRSRSNSDSFLRA